MLLGDLSLEQEGFDQALVDYQSAITLLMPLVASSQDGDDRVLAECHYKAAIACEHAKNTTDALVHLDATLHLLQTRLDRLSSTGTFCCLLVFVDVCGR
jgi:hypothetical protein